MVDNRKEFIGKKIIITGATGFMGSHIARELIHRGAKVSAFVRVQSDPWRLRTIINDIEIIDVDLQDFDAVSEIMKRIRPNYIFHFAIPSHSLLKNLSDLKEQIDLTNSHLIHLFQSIINHEIQLDSFVHACSSTVYSWDTKRYILTENTPLKPTTLRGMLKLSQRDLCQYLGAVNGIPVKLARIFRAYGPWEADIKLIRKALDAERTNVPISIGEDKYKRDYIYIDDLVEGILRLALSNLPSGIEINFGSNKQYSAIEIIHHIERILGKEIPKTGVYPRNLFDQGDYVADCSLAQVQLGWSPTTELDQGLKITIDWYQNHYQ